jgi:hypothetical protein
VGYIIDKEPIYPNSEPAVEKADLNIKKETEPIKCILLDDIMNKKND